MKLFTFLIVLTLILITQSKNHNCRRNTSNPYNSGYYYGSGYDYYSGDRNNEYCRDNSEEEEFYQVVIAVVIAVIIVAITLAGLVLWRICVRAKTSEKIRNQMQLKRQQFATQNGLNLY